MREAAELRLLELILMALGDEERLRRPITSASGRLSRGAVDASLYGSTQLHPKWLLQHLELSKSQASETTFLGAWLSIQWNALAQVMAAMEKGKAPTAREGSGGGGLNVQDVKRRAQEWREWLHEIPRVEDLVQVWRDLEELRMMGSDVHLWRSMA